MFRTLLWLYLAFLGLGVVLFILASLIALHPEWLLNSLLWVRVWQVMSGVYLFSLICSSGMLYAMWAEEREKKDKS